MSYPKPPVRSARPLQSRMMPRMNQWGSFIRLLGLLLGFVLYVYAVMLVKLYYTKVNKLDELLHMSMETKEAMGRLKTIDEQLTLSINELNFV